MTDAALVPGLPAWAIVSPKRVAHITRVVDTLTAWADALDIPEGERRKWLRAAWLHDALRDAPLEELRRLAPATDGPVDLLHGPAAAARARQEGERDAEVLLAVEHHTLGYAPWTRPGWILFCADYLEPGRRFEVESRALLRAQLPHDPLGTLREVVRVRVIHGVRSGWPLHEQTAALWNRVADAAPCD
jgi:HD superfamily phosphohydrolase YqeK